MNNNPLLDMEGTIARIVAAIEGEEGWDVESFISAIDGPSPTSTSENRLTPHDRMVYRETMEIVDHIETLSSINVWGFIFNFLDHRFYRRRPQNQNLRGNTVQSGLLVRGILMSIREVLEEAGNKHVWREFIQEQADELQINCDELD